MYGWFLQQTAFLVKHIVQESLKKFRNSGPSLSKRKKRTRNNPTQVETFFKISAKVRKSDSNKTITLVLDTGTQRKNVAMHVGSAPPPAIKQKVLK
jgi:hypothetical protein